MSNESIDTDERIKRLDQMLGVTILKKDKLKYRNMLETGDNASTDSQSVNSLYDEIMKQYPEAKKKESDIKTLIGEWFDAELKMDNSTVNTRNGSVPLKRSVSHLTIPSDDFEEPPYLVTIHEYESDRKSLKKDSIMAANLNKEIFDKIKIELKPINEVAKVLPSTHVESLIIEKPSSGGKRSRRKSAKRKSSKPKRGSRRARRKSNKRRR